MDVILLERIESLGQMGDVVSVKPGYARNYLLPQKKALRATEDNKRIFEGRRAQLEAENLEGRTDAEAVAAKLDGLSVLLRRQAGDAGQLYGSVNARDIAQAVSEAGFTVDRRQVQLSHPIKAVGLYQVRLGLHPEITVAVTVNVARSEEEAAIQTKTGRAAIHLDEEEEGRAAGAEVEKEAVRKAAERVFDAPSEEQIAELTEEPSPDSLAESAPDSGEAAGEGEARKSRKSADGPAKDTT